MKETSDNGVYYFIGNITSHILHALPLHKELGGTFVVLSEKARKKVMELYDVPVIAIDDVPYQWHRYSYKIKPVHEYSDITSKHSKTINFLNKKARVVLFYELFKFPAYLQISKPKTIFLTHGNMLKDYMGENNRVLKMNSYDYMAALGPAMKRKLIKKGVSPEKLIDIGIARTDEVVKNQKKIVISPEIKELMNNSSKPIVSYMPTFWGASSIYNTGVDILLNLPSDFNLIFRPHPHTPRRLLRKYTKIINKRENIYFVPDSKFNHISLIDIYNASSVIIGDVSSVMLEAILTKKPLIFAYDNRHKQKPEDYTAIREVVRLSQQVNHLNVSNIGRIIHRALEGGVDDTKWQNTIDTTFFCADNTSVDSIKRFLIDI